MSRRMMMVVGLLSGTALLAADTTARAQVSFGRGYGGRGGVSIGFGSGYGNSYGSGWYGNSYGSGWHGTSPYWGSGLYGGNYYAPGGYSGMRYSASPYWNYNYASPRYGAYSGYSPSYTWGSTPVYGSAFGTTDANYAQAPNSGNYTSFYSGPNPGFSATNSGIPASPDRVNLLITVPNPDAQVWIEGEATEQRGFQRLFTSPPLSQGKYRYHVKASWTENGQTITKEKDATCQPGQELNIAFIPGADDRVSTPPLDRDVNRSPLPDANRTTVPDATNRNLDRELNRPNPSDLNRPNPTPGTIPIPNPPPGGTTKPDGTNSPDKSDQ